MSTRRTRRRMELMTMAGMEVNSRSTTPQTMTSLRCSLLANTKGRTIFDLSPSYYSSHTFTLQYNDAGEEIHKNKGLKKYVFRFQTLPLSPSQ